MNQLQNKLRELQIIIQKLRLQLEAQVNSTQQYAEHADYLRLRSAANARWAFAWKRLAKEAVRSARVWKKRSQNANI
jgi:hypothetical protein